MTGRWYTRPPLSDFGSQSPLVRPERLPLDDVCVLAIEQYGAGPWATEQLVALGAEVIKIEEDRSGGDVGRYVPPFQHGEDSLFFETFNAGKRSIALDLKSPEGRAVFLRLVPNADIVFSNLRGDLPAKLGLRYEDLCAANPAIVCCSLSGYGMDGPLAAQGALDSVIQGRAGWMSVTGEPGSPPTRTGLSLVDFAAGYVAAIAMLGGVMRARRDGTGCDCDLSLNETALSLLTYLGTWTASRGFVPERMASSAHPSLVPFQNFETADGWIVIACPKQDLWLRLCDAIDRDDLPGRPEYADLAARAANRERLVETLSETLRTRTTVEWLEVLEAVGVPSGPVNDIPTALENAHLQARGGIEAYEHETLGTVRRVRSPLRLSGPRWKPSRAPRRGEHTDELLRESGFEADEIVALADAGAFGASRRTVVEES